MTSRIKPNQQPVPQISTVVQPAFDPRIRSISWPLTASTSGIVRGFMIWDTSVTWPNGYSKSNPPSLQFLYNPSTIAASYQISDATASAAMIYVQTSDPAILRVPLQQQVGFTIYFDRTYELNGTSDPTTQIMRLGCEVDVLALKQFTGMFASTYKYNDVQANASGAPVGSLDQNVNTSSGSGSGIQQGVMQLTLCYCYFGTPGYGLQYYGYIDSWDVQYTHFTSAMIPMRCVVNISFTLLPPPQKNVPQTSAQQIAQQQGGGAIASYQGLQGSLGGLGL